MYIMILEKRYLCLSKGLKKKANKIPLCTWYIHTYIPKVHNKRVIIFILYIYIYLFNFTYIYRLCVQLDMHNNLIFQIYNSDFISS